MSTNKKTPVHVEQLVLRLFKQGLSGRQVARELDVPETTVRAIKKRATAEGLPCDVDFNDLAKSRYDHVVAGFQEAPMEKPEDFYSDNEPNVPASKAVTRVLAIGDAHDDLRVPKNRFTWFGKHAAEMQPDHIVQIGDIADLESLSFHSPNDTDKGKYKPRFLAEMKSLEHALDLMFTPMARRNVKARVDIPLGNHENRIWRYEDAFPETVGMLQGKLSETLTNYGIFAHQFGKYIDIAGVKFTHSPFSVMGKPVGGMNATATIARQASGDIVFGHTHKANVNTTPRIGGEDKVTVIDLGCALPQGFVAPYAKHTLTGWSWGIWELTIQGGSIQGYNFIPMAELERRYGK